MIICVQYYSPVDFDYMYESIDIGNTCFCMTRAEVVGYAFNKAYNFCQQKGVDFVGFEIVAE